jgi:hypothetical protein
MTTALEAIKSAYPGQYYGTVSGTGSSVSAAYDVWDGTDAHSQRFDLLALAAANSLVPFSSDQFALAKAPGVTGFLTIPVSSLEIQYPARFYCDSATPCAVYDMWGFSEPPTSPVASSLYAITAAEYADRQANPRQQYYDTASGKLADYVAPPVVLSLKDQAATALAAARTYVNNTYTMLNEATPDAWVTYLKALMAIASGADTTSTALPTEPAT